MELSPVEKLAIAQAFQNNVGDMTKRNAYNLRGEVDDYYRAIFEQTGAKSFDVNLLGNKVGTYTIQVGKGKPARTETAFEIYDFDALKAWAAANDCLKVDMDKVRALFTCDGEIPDGCTPITTEIPETPAGQIEKTTLRIDSGKVFEVIRAANALPDAVRPLLAGE